MRKFYNFLKIIDKSKGFTLIEVLVSIVILIVGVLGVMTLMGKFSTSTLDRAFRNAIVDAAASAIDHCENTHTDPPTSYTYGGITVTISKSGSCNPAANTCNNVTVTATAQGKSFSITSKVCNFD